MPPSREKFNSKYRIQSARLQGYDYSQNGAYFITICTKNKQNTLGKIIPNQIGYQIQHTKLGEIVNEYWHNIPEYFPFAALDESIIMPNHLHGIILIQKNNAPDEYRQSINNTFIPQSGNLASIIRGFKAGVTKYAEEHLGVTEIWQPRYHDRIIRNETEYERIVEYIITNPENWQKDDYYHHQ